MIHFRSAAGERPVRLSEETRIFAWESLNGKYGRELDASDHLTLRREEAQGLTDYQLYDLLISKTGACDPRRNAGRQCHAQGRLQADHPCAV